MSELTKSVEKTYSEIEDFSEVLRQVAEGFRNVGFFVDSKWCDLLVETFKSEEKIDRSKIMDITDNEHEISSSFVGEPSTRSKKSTTPIHSDVECKSFLNDANDDSNDSFEIPETQTLPPTLHPNDDEHSSEGFITMPAEAHEPNDFSQSQVLFELGKQSAIQPGFDDDSIDLEMSKLEWEESSKDLDKSKSASVTPDVLKPVEVEYDRSASVTPDLDFQALPSTMTKSIMDSLASPKQLQLPNVIKDNSSISTNEIDKSASSAAIDKIKCNEDNVQPISPLENISDPENVNDAKISSVTSKAEHTFDDDDKENFGKKRPDDELFKKPFLPNEIANNTIDDDDEKMPETQLPTDEVIESGRVMDNAHDVDLDETQVFIKSNDRQNDQANNSNQVVDETIADEKQVSIESLDDEADNLNRQICENVADETQVFVKSNDGKDEANNANEAPSPKPTLRRRNRLISSDDDEDATDVPVERKTKTPVEVDTVNRSNDDEAYNIATQIFPTRNHNEVDVNPKDVDQSKMDDDVFNAATQKFENVDRSNEDDDVFNAATQKFEPQNVEKSNDDVDVFNAATQKFENVDRSSEDDDVFNAATQKFEPEEPQSPTEKRISEFKRNDWSKLCEQINSKQSKTEFETTFDQSKGLRKVNVNDVATVPSTIDNVVTGEPVRKSTRDRNKVKPVPAETVNEDAKVDIGIDIQATQLFVKATSTPKEETKPSKALPRGQKRAATEEPDSKVVKQLIRKTRSVRDQSVTYSPKPVIVKQEVSADVNENLTARSSNTEGTNSTSTRSRKRKAATEIELNESNESTNSRSSSGSRSTRNQSYRVMFTMLDSGPHAATLKELNIPIATSDNYNVLITDKVYRTSKFMCALAAGKPIVSVKWLNELKTKKSLVDPFEFLLKDEVGEKKYEFSLAKTLREVRKNGVLLRNHSILVTPNTSPPPDILKDVIVSSGGKYLKTSLVPRKDDIILCISDQQDKKLVGQLNKKYSKMREITVEDFMQSIFRYEI